MIDKKIEIVSTNIPEHNVASLATCDGIYDAICTKYSNVRITFLDNLKDIKKLIIRNPDLVFLRMGLAPPFTNNTWVSNILDDNFIKYTGSSKQSLLFGRYKNMAKQQIVKSDIMTSPFYLSNNNGKQNNKIRLSYPLFVKPNDKGSGLGIDDKSIIYNSKDLKTKIKENYKLYLTDSLVEEFLPGREFTVTLLKLNDSTEYNIMPIELIAPKNKNGDRILGSKIKEADTESSKIVPEGELKDKISELAYKSFCAIGGRDYGRIDIRLDKNGVPNFLEANFFPSLVKDFGNFPKACKTFLGYSYEQTILHITNLGMQRVNNQNTDHPQNMVLAVNH